MVGNAVRVMEIASYTVWYNFREAAQEPSSQPCYALSLSDRLWSMEELAEMIGATLPKPGWRGAYPKRENDGQPD